MAEVLVCKDGEIAEGGVRVIQAGAVEIGVIRHSGKYYAYRNLCPHQGGPLGQGELTGCIVTCPWHGWQFDVRTGQHQLSRSMKQPRFDTKVEDGSVWVEIPD